MRKTIVSTIILILISVLSFAQSKNIGILIASDAEGDHNKTVSAYFIAHLKKVPSIAATELSGPVSKQAKEDIANESGKFADTAILSKVNRNGIKEILFVAFSASPLETVTTIKGVKKTSYGCRVNFYVQQINAANGEVTSSKQFYGSVGTAIVTKENYKTKDEAVRAAFEASAPADYRDKTTINIDNYLKKIFSL